MPSCNTYHLTWVSLNLDVGYLFTAAPAKCSHCSLPWTRVISSPATRPGLGHGVAPLNPPVPMQPPLLGCGAALLGCLPISRACGSSSQLPPWPRECIKSPRECITLQIGGLQLQSSWVSSSSGMGIRICISNEFLECWCCWTRDHTRGKKHWNTLKLSNTTDVFLSLLFVQPFIHFFIRYLLNTHWVPGMFAAVAGNRKQEGWKKA